MSIFLDPLRSDEPKPLRRSEYMSLATSLSLRQTLRTHGPILKPMLKALDSLKDQVGKEEILKKLLGLDKQSLDKVRTETVTQAQIDEEERGFYIPTDGGMERTSYHQNHRKNQNQNANSNSNSNSNSNRKQQGKTREDDRNDPGAGTGAPNNMIWVAKDEKEAMRDLAEVIRSILETEERGHGQSGRKAEWEV